MCHVDRETRNNLVTNTDSEFVCVFFFSFFAFIGEPRERQKCRRIQLYGDALSNYFQQIDVHELPIGRVQ